MSRFRERRNELGKEMATLREFDGRDGLIKVARDILEPWGVTVSDDRVSVVPYAFNDRTGWDEHIVYIKDYGVLGYTDGPVHEARS